MNPISALLDLTGWILSGLVVVLKWICLAAFRALRWLWQLCFVKGSTTFGSARWASLRDIRRAGLVGHAGIIVGKIGRRFIRFNGDGAILLFARSAAGKGVGVVIPNLLDYPGSVICTDIKGENHAITARHREAFGPVFTLNLQDPTVSDSFNPLDTVRMGTQHEVDDAELIADLMVMPGAGGDLHWDEKARARLTGFILYVLHHHKAEPELRTLTEVRRLLTQHPEAFEELLDDMSAYPLNAVRETANDFLGMGTEERRSVRSNMEKATKIWAADRAVAPLVGRSDFTLESFKDRTATLYLVVPEDKLAVYAPFLRVMVGLTLTAMTRNKHKPRHDVLLLLDELAALGYLQPLEAAIGYMRAYARLLLVFQDLDQLKQTYRLARSITANASCKIAFGVADYETAELLSKSVGQTTVQGRSQGETRDIADLMAQRQQAGLSEAGRWLIDPAEVLNMPDDEALVFVPKVKAPIRARKVRYYQEARWRGQWDTWRDTAA